MDSSLSNWDGSKSPSKLPAPVPTSPKTFQSTRDLSSSVQDSSAVSSSSKRRDAALDWNNPSDAPWHDDGMWSSKTIQNSNPLTSIVPPSAPPSSSKKHAKEGRHNRADTLVYRDSDPHGLQVRVQGLPTWNVASSSSAIPTVTSPTTANSQSLKFGPPHELLTKPLASSYSSPAVLHPSISGLHAPNYTLSAPSTPTTNAGFGLAGAALRPAAGSGSSSLSFGAPGPVLCVPPSSTGLVAATLASLSVPSQPRPAPKKQLAPSPHSQYRQHSVSNAPTSPSASNRVLWPAPMPTSPTTPTTLSNPNSYLHTNPNGSSPLSNLSPSPASASNSSRAAPSPAPANSVLQQTWWLDELPSGRKYREDKTANEHMVTIARTHEKEKAKAKDKERKHKEKWNDTGTQAVVYTSHVKKTEKATSTSGNGVDRHERSTLFIQSPKVVDATPTPPFYSYDSLRPNLPHIADTDTDADPLNLFTPPPADARAFTSDGDDDPLFTPPPPPANQEQQQHPERTRKPGLGVARRVVREEQEEGEARPRPRKRGRQVMKYVLVPPAPYSIKRARMDGRGDWDPRDERVGGGQRGRSGSVHQSRSRSTHDYYRSELSPSPSRSRSRSRVDPRNQGPAPIKTKTKVKTQRKTGTGEGQVHDSLDDALNNSWAHNEAMGTMPVGRAAGDGAERGKRKHDVQEGEKERLAKRPKKEKVAARQEGEKRKTRRPDDDLAPAVPPRRPGAWCEDVPEDGVIHLHFDVTVAEADHAACAALLNTGVPGFEVAPAGAETSASLVEDARVQLRPTCLVWPPRFEVDERDVSAGGSVYDGNELQYRPGRWIGEGAKREKLPRSETPAGRQQESERHMKSISVAHEIQYAEQSPRAQPKSKARQQPHTLPAPSTSRPLASSQPLPAVNFTPASDSPFESQPDSTPSDLDVQQTEIVVDAPMSLSAKAMGKQKMPDEDVRRTPSPDHINAWIHNSGSRDRRSVSRGRFDDTPIGELSPFYSGFDPSPPRAIRSGLKISPGGLHHYPTAPRILDSIPTSFMHSPELQVVPSLFPMPDEPYGDGTVDPSMLMSGMMIPDVVDPFERESETEDPYEVVEEEGSDGNAEDQEVACMATPFSPSTSTSSSSSSVPAPPSPAALRASRRVPVQRRIPDDMVATDVLDFDFDGNSSSSSSVYIDQSPKPTPTPASKPKPPKSKPVAAKRIKAAIDDAVIPASHDSDPFFRYVGPPWPPGDPDAFCHQCRTKTKRLNMRFEDCQHVYCVRCIMTKYEPHTVRFESMASSTNCGKCNGSCTCDNCCTRRGEVYHFARPRFKAESRKAEPRTPRTLPRPLPRPQHNPYEFLNDIIIDPTTYHAILYDLNGAPIARTFFGADGDTKVVVAQPRRRRREFIGDLHESWRSLGPNPVVYVDPPLPGKLKRNGEKKRLYIGDQSVLSLPIRARAPLLSPPFVPLPAMPAEDPVAGVAVAPVDPVTPPARAPDIEVDVHLLNLDSFDVGPPVPATPQTPAPLDIEIDFDPPDPFASPLTSIDSETSGDEADGVLEKTDKSPAVTSAMRAVVLENAGDEDPVVTSPMAAMGFEKAGNEDPTVPSVMAALNDYASSAAGSDDEEPWGPSEAVGEAQGEPTVPTDAGE